MMHCSGHWTTKQSVTTVAALPLNLTGDVLRNDALPSSAAAAAPLPTCTVRVVVKPGPLGGTKFKVGRGCRAVRRW